MNIILPAGVHTGAGFNMVMLGIVLPLVMLFNTYIIVLPNGLIVDTRDIVEGIPISVVAFDIRSPSSVVILFVMATFKSLENNDKISVHYVFNLFDINSQK
jgi:hypothetical protein